MSEINAKMAAARDEITSLLEQINSGKLKTADKTNPASEFGPSKLASYIDHTSLAASATTDQIKKLCHEAIEYQFYAVCVNSVNIGLCKSELAGGKVKICTVVGFPLGAVPTKVKVCETKMAEKEGANEIDMVINIGALKDNNFELVFADIYEVVNSASKNLIKKVIIENCYLNPDEKIKAIVFAKHAGADFVKTSTGFGPSGATIEDVELMRYIIGPNLGVKAAGGIRDRATAVALINAGASRIGASASVNIVKGL